MALSAACECGAEKQTIDHCPPLSNPSTTSWNTWSDGSGKRENGIAAQRLPRDLVQPSSG